MQAGNRPLCSLRCTQFRRYGDASSVDPAMDFGIGLVSHRCAAVGGLRFLHERRTGDVRTMTRAGHPRA